MKASRVDRGHVELRHVNLAQLLADGPASDLALTADVRGGGESLETITGAVDLSVPASQVRKATVGPVELHATADRGMYDLRELRAVLPGLRLTGRGKGTTKAIQASVDAEATDLALLGRTFGSLSASRFPPLAGSGKLHVEATGPLRHPGVGAEGTFPSLRVSDTQVRALKLSVHMEDVNRVLDANAQISAQELRLGERVLKPVESHASHARPRAGPPRRDRRKPAARAAPWRHVGRGPPGTPDGDPHPLLPRGDVEARGAHPPPLRGE